MNSKEQSVTSLHQTKSGILSDYNQIKAEQDLKALAHLESASPR